MFLFANCNHENRKIENSSMSNSIQTFKKLSPDTDFSVQKVILIIPFDGCSSCFEKAISLIPKVNSNGGLTIMPCLQKRRIYNLMEDRKLNNIVSDTLQLTVKNNLVTTNPMIYVTNANKIIFSELVDQLDVGAFQSKYFE